MKSSFRNLQEYIAALEAAGELLRIRVPVSPHLEITQITDLVSKSPRGGKALLFEQVVGSPFPVLTNAFGSERRICMALGVSHLDELASRVRRYLEIEPPRTVRDGLRLLPMAFDLRRFLPRLVKRAPCQEVIRTGREVDLSILPVLTCWPQDAGPFITLPLVITRSLTSRRRNVGMYRLQVFDRQTTGMHWHIHKDGSHYFQEYRRAGRRMPVAVAIGTDPATTYAATAPLPRGMDEILLAGFIRKQPVPLVKCVTVDLEVPAEAEFVLEGYVDPEELRLEGPFGDHTGYYSLVDRYPVFHVTALTHRAKPVYATTIVGRPPMEDCYLGKATERMFLPMLNTILPEIQNYWLPWEGVFHNATVVSINKEYPGHARRVMSALWGQGQMSFCKNLIVVDPELDLKDPRNVLQSVLDRIDLETDLTITEGVLDALDHSAPEPFFGGKLGVDATRRLPEEAPRKPPPEQTRMPSAEVIRGAMSKVSERLLEYCVPDLKVHNRPLLVTISKDENLCARSLAEALLSHPDLAFFRIFVIFDQSTDLTDGSLVLWRAFNNIDPKRDIVRVGGRLLMDATRKGPQDGHFRPWPDDIVMDPAIVEKVNLRLEELGIDRVIAPKGVPS